MNSVNVPFTDEELELIKRAKGGLSYHEWMIKTAKIQIEERKESEVKVVKEHPKIELFAKNLYQIP